MSKRFMATLRAPTLGALAMAGCLLLAPAALAHHKPGHDQGGGSKATASQSEPDDLDDNEHPSGKDKETNNGPADDEQGKSKSNPDNDGHGPERNSCPGSGEGECVDKPGGDGGVDRDDQDGNNGCGNDDDFEDDNEGWCGKPHDKQQKAKRTCESSEHLPPGQAKKCETSPADSPCEEMSSKDKRVCGQMEDEVKEVCSKDENMTEEGMCDKSEAEAAAEKVCVKNSSMSAKEKKKCNSIKDEVLGDVISKGNGGTGGPVGGRPDQVLAATATSPGPAPEVAGAALSSGEDEALGGILPFTGARIVAILIAALLLVAGGLLLMRVRGGRAT